MKNLWFALFVIFGLLVGQQILKADVGVLNITTSTDTYLNVVEKEQKLKLRDKVAANLAKAKQKINRTKENDGTDRKTHKKAITGFVLAVAGIAAEVLLWTSASGVGFFLWLGLSVAAVIFSIIALKKINRNPEIYKGKGWAIAGLILGLSPVALLLLFIIGGGG